MVRTTGLLVCCLIAVLLVNIPSAEGLSPGTYRCSAYNISGGGGSCRNVPPLLLNPDGSFQYSSTRGKWNIVDGRLNLSPSRIWGSGMILGSDTVRFEYDYGGWHHTVTWVCEDCRSAAKSPSGSPATGGVYIGVSLKLEFDGPVGGVGTYTIVPAQAAPSYGHNAPLPEGAVQGVAWESSRNTVSLATNRNNKLISGRRYVVFLSWPRETIPVAILDLPAQQGDYTAVLPATLIADQVWRKMR